MKKEATIMRKIDKNRNSISKFRNATSLDPVMKKRAIKTLEAINRELNWVLN
jgi:hypothetical protein